MRITGPAVVLGRDDVDTDQIIPARFLTTTGKDGLGDALFADWRAAGLALGRGAVLVAGANFGCGSSREHAVWALRGWGFRAVIAPSFADIFRQNALKNGLLPVALDGAAIADGAEVTVDLAAQTVTVGGASWGFAIDPFAKRCLIAGQDELGYLLARLPEVEDYERTAGAAEDAALERGTAERPAAPPRRPAAVRK
jgi:3-isopropylmalate/(R)-2-methylmalate dehydratase small subunit